MWINEQQIVNYLMLGSVVSFAFALLMGIVAYIGFMTMKTHTERSQELRVRPELISKLANDKRLTQIPSPSQREQVFIVTQDPSSAIFVGRFGSKLDLAFSGEVGQAIITAAYNELREELKSMPDARWNPMPSVTA